MDGAGSSQDCCVLEKQNKLDDQVTELKKKVQVVSVGLVGALKLADQIQFALISEEIPELKRRQQISCIGGPASVCLDQLQNWFTCVAECLQQVRQQLNILQELAPRFSQHDEPFRDLSSLQEQERSLFENLLINSLVVERQPCLVMHPHTPLVLRICVQFTVKVRLLVRLPDLNEQLKVKVTFDKDLPENDTVKSFQRFNVLGNTTRIMNVEESNGCFVAEFRHLV
ncbi:signal transducer and activator of transcription 1-like [Trichomycterus rosablanca]|uniref:signal transducer and activator of transcription 1-like n=1 Tax=Trichomycterus rosablanca TaxID=2290929 RepID=UPI002F35A189